MEDWGSGQPADLGKLRLTPEQAAGGDGRRAFAPDQPFYEQLARRLEALQASGGLGGASPTGVAPLPPFDRWAFKLPHYLQV